MRILVVTRSYPAEGDLYQYPFVHRRVLAYRDAGHDVAVFRPAGGEARSHDYEGVTCTTGDGAALAQMTLGFDPDVVAAHGLSETMWPALSGLPDVPILAWLHGSEIPAFFRQKADAIADPEARAEAMAQVERRALFWTDVLDRQRPDLKLVFPSRAAVAMMREDLGALLTNAAVIPNPIDTTLFGYEPKSGEQRFHVLSIRPFDSTTYANDLSVAAILALRERAGFDEMHFTIIGDGPLFDETLEPLRGMTNVAIRRQFLTQAEIAAEHSRHGIFLVPTRLDTQGVSRDEAMSSGLVPVTNAIPAVLEFTDDACAALALPNDAGDLAGRLWELVQSAELFAARSAAAAARVRRQTANDLIIPAELALLAETV
jgi:glycosyltransferase involved in cell wall biosynthesis